MIANKILGFVRETSLAATFGATAETDAYLLAQAIPLILFETVSYALTTTFIPVYSRVQEERGKEAGFRFVNNVTCVALCVGVLLVVVGEIWIRELVAVVAPGLDSASAQMTQLLSRIMLPMMVFQLLSGIVNGVLNAEGEFAVPTAANLVPNLTIIVSVLVFGSRYGIEAVAVGTVIGSIISFVVRLPALARTGFRWQATIDLRDPGLQWIAVLLLPAVLAAGANQINTLIDRMLASGLPEGRIAALNYANRLMQLAPSIIGTSIVTVVYPTLARLAAKGAWQQFNDGLVRLISLVHFVLAPIAIGVLVLREPLVRIVYERGAFDVAATYETSWALLFLSLGIAALSMRELVSRAFFTMQDTRTPLVLGIVTIGINIVLNLLLVGPLAQGGLALATSIATVLGFVIGVMALRRKAQVPLFLRPMVISIAKTLLASILMGIAVALVYESLRTSFDSLTLSIELFCTFAATAVGAVVYLGMTWLLQVRELRDSVYYAKMLARSMMRRG